MATLVLSAIGTAIGGPVGGYLGAAIGAYIDQALLFPAPDTKGPRLDSLALSSASEGTPIYFCLGQECRVPGQYIFASPLDEHAHEQGKGGPSATNYTYSADVAIAFCEGPINRIVKLWANGRVIFDDDPDITVISNQIAFTRIQINHYVGNTEVIDYIEVFGDLTSPSSGPDLRQFHTGVDVAVSGFSTVANNGTWRIISTSRNELTGATKLSFRANGAVATDAGGETITLFQDLPKFSEDDFQSITSYLGTSTQLPNSLIEAHEGTGQVPGYRNIAYCVLEGFELKNYGNTLPQVQALIEQSSGVLSLSEAIQLICRRSKLPDELFDVSEVIGDIRGYAIRGPQPLDQQLGPLLIAYDILTQEDNGVLKFFNRANADVVTLDSAELAAHEPDSDPARPLETVGRRPQGLPSAVVVNYADPGIDYLRGSQTDVRQRAAAEYVITLDLENITLSGVEAKIIARRVLWTAVANAKRHSLQIGPSRIDILENDIVEFEIDELKYRVLLSQVDQGQNGICILEGGNEFATTLSFDNVTVDDPEDPDGHIYIPPHLISQIMDIAALRDEQLDLPGYYFVATTSTGSPVFRGGSLFTSQDGGNSYTNVLDIFTEGTIGYSTTSLGDASYGYVDRKNTVTVQLYRGELESVTELTAFGGRNWALLGREIISFETATLIDSHTYTLSGLCRGLRDTSERIGTHVANELFILLDPNSIFFRSIPISSINANQYFKALSVGQLLGNVTAQQYAVKANNLKPFSPCGIKAVRDGSNNVTVSWTRRTRALIRIFGGTGIPLSEDIEKYEIDILNVAETLVLATVVVTAATSTTILDTTITGLGLVSGAAVHLRIYQISALVGRGKGKLAVV